MLELVHEKCKSSRVLLVDGQLLLPSTNGTNRFGSSTADPKRGRNCLLLPDSVLYYERLTGEVGAGGGWASSAVVAAALPPGAWGRGRGRVAGLGLVGLEGVDDATGVGPALIHICVL